MRDQDGTRLESEPVHQIVQEFSEFEPPTKPGGHLILASQWASYLAYFPEPTLRTIMAALDVCIDAEPARRSVALSELLRTLKRR